MGNLMKAKHHLLRTIELPALKVEDAFTFIQEFPVNPLLAPYIVTGVSSRVVGKGRTVVGVKRARGGALVRAAIRKDLGRITEIYLEILKVAAKLSLKNVFRYSRAGITEALEHVHSLGVTEGSDLEVLVPPNSSWGKKPFLFGESQKAIPMMVPWLTKRTAVIVPQERAYLGDLHVYGGIQYSIVVHNVSRGLALSGSFPL
jgi:hypothetical protein